MGKRRNVAVFIFNNVEILDFTGPYEVFSITDNLTNGKSFRVYTVSETQNEITTWNSLIIKPSFTFNNCPKPDVIIIPGGMGARKEMNNAEVINWLKTQSNECELILSVCTGALILGKSGLLNGMSVTTHKNVLKFLKEVEPEAKVVSEKRYIDNGNIILSAGISAGIDMSFHVVAKLLGIDTANKTAKHMEYPWKPEKEFVNTY